MSRTISHTAALAALLVAIALCAWPGLSGPFTFDDYPNLGALIDNPTPDYAAVIFSNHSGLLGRSVAMASFVANHWLDPSFSPFTLKLTNLLIHAANAMLVYAFTLLVLGRRTTTPRALALLCALIWAINPVNSSLPFYVVQRMALLSSFFVLIGCIAYFKGRSAVAPVVARRWLLLSLVCLPLATLSKENGILLPLLLLCIELCFFDGLRNRVRRLSNTERWTLLWLMSGVLTLILVALASLGLLDFSGRDFSLAQRLAIQPMIVLEYVQKSFAPASVDVGLFRDDIIAAARVGWAAWLADAVILILLAISLLNLRHPGRRHWSFGFLFFAVGHLLESTILPLELYYQHRNYLPSVGLVITLVAALAHLAQRWRVVRPAVLATAVYCMFLGWMSWLTATAWRSETALILNSHERHPTSIRTNILLGALLAERGNLDGALTISDRLVQLDPRQALFARIQRMYFFCQANQPPPAAAYAPLSDEIALHGERELATALRNLVATHEQIACTAIDLSRFMTTLSDWVDRQSASGRYSSAELWSLEFFIVSDLLRLGRRDQAIARLAQSATGGNANAQAFLDDLADSDSDSNQ